MSNVTYLCKQCGSEHTIVTLLTCQKCGIPMERMSKGSPVKDMDFAIDEAFRKLESLSDKEFWERLKASKNSKFYEMFQRLWRRYE